MLFRRVLRSLAGTVPPQGEEMKKRTVIFYVLMLVCSIMLALISTCQLNGIIPRLTSLSLTTALFMARVWDISAYAQKSSLQAGWMLTISYLVFHTIVIYANAIAAYLMTEEHKKRTLNKGTFCLAMVLASLGSCFFCYFIVVALGLWVLAVLFILWKWPNLSQILVRISLLGVLAINILYLIALLVLPPPAMMP